MLLARSTLPACLALVLAQAAQGASAPRPFPLHDGFIYPGQPGSDGIVDYEKAFKRAPKRPPGRLSAYHQIEWMVGQWKTSVTDYEYRPPGPGGIIELMTGTAGIEFSADDWWLKLDVRNPGRNEVLLLGYDDLAGRWVLYRIGRPGRAYQSAMVASDWKGNRLTFEPTGLVTFSGRKLTDRLSIVRDGDDQFRIVTEALLPSGRFVAVHHQSFTRTR